MIAEDLLPLTHPVSELRLLPGNPRRGDVDAVARSLERFGQRKPIVARRDGTVVAGNHTLQAARQLGWAHLAVVWVDDDDATAKAFALADNRTAELGGYGPHRVLCGDATNPDDIDRVLGDLGQPGIVYTDPPYGISIVNEHGKVGHHTGTPFGGIAKGTGAVIPTTKYMPVAGDGTTEVAADAFRLLTATYPKTTHVWWGGNHYTAAAGLPDSSCWLVWDKETGQNTFADCELAWTNHDGAVRLLRHMWNGMLRASERGKRVHPTQKPVALAEWTFGVLDPDSKRKTVLDVFGGSGSTLIAAHITGRAAAVIEMEAAYVDVICRRFQQATGVKPERVLEDGTTEPHDFTGVS